MSLKKSIDFSSIDEAVPDDASSTNEQVLPTDKETRSSDGNTDNNIAGRTTEDIFCSVADKNILKSLYLTKDGRILKLSKLFLAKPVRFESRYRPRRLLLKRKRALTRPVAFMDDQVELFRRPPTQSFGGRAKPSKPSLYQSILSTTSNDCQSKKSALLIQLEEIFENRPAASECLLSNYLHVLAKHDRQLDEKRRFHPIELMEWEENIIFDPPPKTSATVLLSASSNRLSCLYAGVPPLASSSHPPSHTGSASGPSSRATSPIPILFNYQQSTQTGHAQGQLYARLNQQLSPSLYLRPTQPLSYQTQTQPQQQLSRLSSPPPGSMASLPSRQQSSLSISSTNSSRSTTPMLHVIAPRSIAGRILNNELAFGQWEDQIIWDDRKLPISLPIINLQLPLADPNLIFEPLADPHHHTLTDKMGKLEKSLQKRVKKTKHGLTSDGKSLVLLKYEKPVSDRFNLSNDKNYEKEHAPTNGPTSTGKSATTAAHRTIMSSSRIGVQHSVPALKLSPPFYKTFLNTTDLRSWHRPKLDTIHILRQKIQFEKLIKNKEAPSRRNAAGIISSAKKISLRDRSSDFVLLEYSEEFPLLMSNVGMASLLFNYYRKQHPKDVSNFSEFPYGVLKVLEPNEASPFWIFGDVRPGQFLTAIQNNLLRAPLFDHETPSTDFLLLKYNIKGKTSNKWYLKPLPQQVSLVGQIFPTTEVFGPHSRKFNLYCKARVQSFAYRLFKKDAKANAQDDADYLPKLKISRIMAAFPQFSEGSLRKWLKDYADSVRTGHNAGTWRLRRDAPVLNEEDIRALMTPEMICQHESMLSGQQRLNDSGFMEAPDTQIGLDDEFTVDNESGEIRLAPWNLSSNFINATTAKCTLQLHGIGDPSGRGEAFSFVKVPLKMSVGAKLSTIPEKPEQDKPSTTSTTTSKTKLSSEQITYRQEIVKIWDAQKSALSNPVPPEDESSSSSSSLIDSRTSQDFSVFGESSQASPTTKDYDEAASSASRSSLGRSSGRKLIIKRTFHDIATGLEREEEEIITDPRLLAAYINQRRVWERKRRRRAIAAAASAARSKKARPLSVDSTETPKLPRVPKASNKPKKEVLVQCGACGQIGHMKTNRICPRFVENESPGEPEGGLKISINMFALLSSTQNTIAATTAQDKEIKSSSPSITVKKVKKKKGFDIDSLNPEQRQAFIQLNERFTEVINKLTAAEGSWPFHRPVSKIDYPHYYRMISSPLDFGSIRSRIKRNYYGKSFNLLMDLRHVRDNCLQFNGPDHPFSQTIIKLVAMAEEELATEEIRLLEAKIYGEGVKKNVSETRNADEETLINVE